MMEPPHGLAYIAANLRYHGFQVLPLDAKRKHLKTDQTSQLAISQHLDMIGITAMTPDIVWAARIAEGIKKVLPDIPIIVGGPHVTALPEQTLAEFPAIDIAVIGEGEFTMLELAEAFKAGQLQTRLADIGGICFRNNGKITKSEPRDFLKDLDILPFPAWDLFPQHHNKSSYPVYATRGCPFGCKFCQRVLGNRIRRRSVKNIVTEIEMLLTEFNADGFWFADETFGANRKWTVELLDLLIEHDMAKRAKWHAQTRVDIITEELLTKMKQAGCDGVAFGVESGNREILRKTGKNINLDDVEKAVKLAQKINLKTRSFFILGHPYETMETIYDTIDYAAKLNTTFVSFAVMVPYPGTAVWKLAQQKEAGYNYVSENWDDYRKHLSMPLGFKNIPPNVLRNLDKKAYLVFYWRNRRFKDLFDFLWGYRRLILSYLSTRISSFLKGVNRKTLKDN